MQEGMPEKANKPQFSIMDGYQRKILLSFFESSLECFMGQNSGGVAEFALRYATYRLAATQRHATGSSKDKNTRNKLTRLYSKPSSTSLLRPYYIWYICCHVTGCP